MTSEKEKTVNVNTEKEILQMTILKTKKLNNGKPERG